AGLNRRRLSRNPVVALEFSQTRCILSHATVRPEGLPVTMKASLIACLVLLLPMTPVRAAPHRPLPAEPLEKYEASPMFIFRTGVSAPMLSQFGAFISYQVNV